MTRIAVIGCGAIAETFHLPALCGSLGGEIDLVLVDPNLERAEELAAAFGLSDFAATHHEIADRVDGAVICSPHRYHVPIAIDLVTAGVPVLCEKPLGTSAEEVMTLDALAKERDVIVAVNQTRRAIPACHGIRARLAAGGLGEGLTVSWSEGDRFDWPAATPSMFGASSGGRGVLLDIGAHVLDLLVWWFGSDLEVDDYSDDSFGGSEAHAKVSLVGPGCRVSVDLSWLAKQRNAVTIAGPRGRLEWGVYDLDLFSVELAGKARVAQRFSSPRGGFAGLANVIWQDFLQALSTGSPPLAGAEDVLPSMRLIDECYRRRERAPMPWHPFRGDAA